MKTNSNLTHFVFGEGKTSITIESNNELNACKEYIRFVESKGNESCWGLNYFYQQAKKFVQENG